MKTIFNYRRISTSLLVSLFVLVSCQKERSGDDTVQPDITEEQASVYANESAQADGSFEDVNDISMIAAEEEGIASEGRGETGRYDLIFAALRVRIGNCATITVTPNDTTYPKTITIDFGPTGCLCPDGKFRRGAIVIHLTKPIRRPGAVMTITLVDFYLNRAHVEGTKVVTNLSSGGNIKFTVQVVDGKVTFPNGRGYLYSGLKHVVQVAGGTTNNILDDIYHVEVRSKTIFNNGVTIHLDTEAALVKKVICPWINAGKLKIKVNNRLLFLDFSAPNNGDCDNKALLTWNNGNGQAIITLP